MRFYTSADWMCRIISGKYKVGVKIFIKGNYENGEPVIGMNNIINLEKETEYAVYNPILTLSEDTDYDNRFCVLLW